MKITDETIDHLAHLSRLQFEGAEKEAIKSDLERILTFMSKLNEIPTETIEPLIFMSEEINVLRDDLPKAAVSQSDALKNAAKKDSDYFRVSKVLKK